MYKQVLSRNEHFIPGGFILAREQTHLPVEVWAALHHVFIYAKDFCQLLVKSELSAFMF